MSTDAGSAKPAAAPSRARLLAGALPALLLAVIAIWEVAAAARAGSDVPGDGAWAEAAAAVRAEHRPGDLILFAPRWIDPVGRLHLGDLISLEQAGAMDADRYGRIWELSIRGARADETEGLEPAWTGEFDGVVVRRFEREPAKVVTDLVAALGQAESGGARADLLEVDFRPRRCIAASPGPGRTVQVRWPAVELGSELVGYLGLADIFTLRENLHPARLEVLAGGQGLHTVTAGAGDGWVRFSVPTRPGATELVLRATDLTPAERKGKPGERRHILCFALEARR